MNKQRIVDAALSGTPLTLKDPMIASHFESCGRLFVKIRNRIRDMSSSTGKVSPITHAFHAAVKQHVLTLECGILCLSQDSVSPMKAMAIVTETKQRLQTLLDVLSDIPVTYDESEPPVFIPNVLHGCLARSGDSARHVLLSLLLQKSLVPFWRLVSDWIMYGTVQTGFMVTPAATPEAGSQLATMFGLDARLVPTVLVPGLADLILAIGRDVNIIKVHCGKGRYVFPLSAEVDRILSRFNEPIAPEDAVVAWKPRAIEALLRPTLEQAQRVVSQAVLLSLRVDFHLHAMMMALHDIMLLGRADVLSALTRAVRSQPLGMRGNMLAITAVLNSVIGTTGLILPEGADLDAAKGSAGVNRLALPLLDLVVTPYKERRGSTHLLGLVLGRPRMDRYRHCWRSLAAMGATIERLTDTIAAIKATVIQPFHARVRNVETRAALASRSTHARPWLTLATTMLSGLTSARARVHEAVTGEFRAMLGDFHDVAVLGEVIARHDVFLARLVGKAGAPLVPPVYGPHVSLTPLGQLLLAVTKFCDSVTNILPEAMPADTLTVASGPVATLTEQCVASRASHGELVGALKVWWKAEKGAISDAPFEGV